MTSVRGIARRRLSAAAWRTRAARCLAAAAAIASLTAAVPSPAIAQADGFSDVASGVHKPAIDALDALGVFEGTECAEAMFCPGDEMKRWTMAVWLVRALDEAEPAALSEPSFADVDAGEWWLAHVGRLAALEVTKGCRTEPLRYCPDQSVTRAQMATFLVRAFDLEAAEPAGFTDTAGNTHEASIDALAAAAVTAGCKTEPLTYCPAKPVTRAQMATFLARALGLDLTPEPTQATTTTAFKAVTAGQNHTCGLRTDNTVTCWGYNNDGQADAPAGSFEAVTAGRWHTCGLRTNDTVTCWGDNREGQADAPTGPFKAVAAGGYHTCGLRTDDTVTCWGNNLRGQTDAPTGTFKAINTTVASFFVGHTCGLRTNNTLTCWGDNSDGQTDAPAGSFKAVAAGGYHTCGLRPDDTVTCWGNNNSGQADAPAGSFKAVTAGQNHTCGLRTDNTVTCWGNNNSGQADAPAGSFKAITAGQNHTCGLRTNDTIICWGNNNDGQAVAPVAFKPRLVQDENPGVFLTEENDLSRFIRNTLVEQYADENPWLMEVWNYTNRPDFEYLLGENLLSQVASEYVDIDNNDDSLYRVKSTVMATDYYTLNTSNQWQDLIHEMAHVYTAANNVAREPAPLAIVHLYFEDLSQGVCESHELYADAAPMLVPIENNTYVPYWERCPHLPDIPTEEVVAVVRDAFAGEMPQWFYDTFQKEDGTLDYEAIWTAVKDLDNFHALRVLAIYQLKDAFGGYCSTQAVRDAAFNSSSLKQPWRDGGCNN